MDKYDEKAIEVGCLAADCGGQLCEHMTARIAAALRESAAEALEAELLYLQDLIPPGGSVCRSEILARLDMKVQELRGMFKTKAAAIRGVKA